MRRILPTLTCALVLSACESTSEPVAPQDAGVSDAGHPSDAGTEPPADLGPNDVSILWPLPSGAMPTGLIPVTATGRGGALLPAAVLAAIPPLDRDAPNVAGAIRVVSMRLDPCFPGRDESGPVPCRAQVRLVAQPMRMPPGPGLGVGAADAAVHLHYAVSEAELTALLARIVAAARQAGVGPGAPFGIHPALASEGLEGAFAITLAALILEHLGAENLERVTFTTREGTRAPSWRFGALSVTNGEPSLLPLVAVRGAQPMQTLAASVNGVYDVTPLGSSPDDLSLLFDMDQAQTAVAASQSAAWGAAVRIESPLLHSPESVDCSSCHVAQHLRFGAETAFGLERHPDLYTAPGQSLALPFPPERVDRERIRAFGYFEREPQVLQRTVNETAHVLRTLRGE